MTLWSAAEAAAATGGKATGDWRADGVSIDTRTLQKGDLFVALKVARDGHDFVARALADGAAAALVSRVPEGLGKAAPLLIVADVQRALEALGRAARVRTGARIVAVTGSVGKTSTKEMLACMLGDQGRTHASVASYNNQWGVPLTLARMPADTEYGVIEIGMNHPGEIAPLARLARPHVALITTIAAAHLQAFAGIAEIAVEKASVMQGLEPGGVAVVNSDVPQAAILTARARALKRRAIGFGEQGSDYVLGQVRVTGDTTVVQARANGRPLLFKLATPGRHFAMNALGALAACEALGGDLALGAISLGRWTPFQGRGTREAVCLDPVAGDLRLELIDDAYNANPASMGAALAVLAQTPVDKGRRIAFLGDMKELGADEAALHAALSDLASMGKIDRIHCIGPLMRALYDALPEHRRGDWRETSAEMVRGMGARLRSGDVVLVKGSLSMKLALIVDSIRKMGHPAPQSPRITDQPDPR